MEKRRGKKLIKVKNELNEARAHIAALQEPRIIKESAEDLIRLIRRDNLELPLRSVVDAYLKKCNSIEEVKTIISKEQTLALTNRSIKKARNNKLIDQYREQYKNLNRVIRTKDELFERQDSIGMIFNQNILKSHSSTMLFYSHPIRSDISEWKVRIAHFDGKYSHSSAFTQQYNSSIY